MIEQVDDSLTIVDEEAFNYVMGVIYINNTVDSIAEINIATRRRCLKPYQTCDLLAEAIKYFMKKHELKMIGSFIPASARATGRLADKVGGRATHYLKDHCVVNGQRKDSCYVSILREEVVHG